MAKAPAFQFYPADWIQDTRILTPQTRGIWIDMLCFMWRSDERGKITGTISQLARLMSCTEAEISVSLNELNATKCADVIFCNAECNAIVTVINRRMQREEKDRELTRYRVKRFRNADALRKCNADVNANVTPPSSSSSSLKKESIKKESPPKIEFDGVNFVNIPDALKGKWGQIAPAISIASELAKAEAWVISNPKLRKSNWSRFLTNWMLRAQDSARGGNGDGMHRKSFAGRGEQAISHVQREINELSERANEIYYDRRSKAPIDSATNCSTRNTR